MVNGRDQWLRAGWATSIVLMILGVGGCPARQAPPSVDNGATAVAPDGSESGTAAADASSTEPRYDASASSAATNATTRSGVGSESPDSAVSAAQPGEPRMSTTTDDGPVAVGNSPNMATSHAPHQEATAANSADVLATPTATPAKNRETIPAGANLATYDELNQRIAEDWPEPQVVLFISGQQHGYLEPCGCTGLERQKGGLIRRDTLIQQLRQRGWTVLPMDVGNQVRRIGRQAEIKFQTTMEAFQIMEYQAATLGVDDLKLSSIELIQAASSDGLHSTGVISANVEILDPSFFPSHRIIEAGGRKIGVTAFLDEKFAEEVRSDDISIFPAVDRLKPVVEQMKNEGCDFLVLLAHASLERSAEVAQEVGDFDLVVTAGGYGEPTLLPEPIPGTEAVMVQCGVKGMYGGIVGLFDSAESPLRYQRIAISAQFKDSPRLLELFAKYQEQLKQAGLQGLGVTPSLHPTGRRFVGSETCGDCHTTAYEIWQGTPHSHATDSIVAPPNDRGGIPRHHDPECISCHVTGWNPQEFYPYQSGWLSLEDSPHLVGSGCENCHGPGSDHVAAENGDIDVDNDQLVALRQQMILKLDRARDKCLECHDLDNSPDFHHDGAFEEYWEQVKHYGKD
ncbi:MAG: cytochrome c554 [Pirellulaceae bacterium]|nr:MAG: cytochrome c554 [Pirellulaceae bacterium]